MPRLVSTARPCATLSLALASVALGSLALASVTAASGQTIEPSLREASKEYDRAQMQGDRKALENIVSDDYILINSRGKQENKKDLIEGFAHPGFRMEPFQVKSPFEKVLGNTVILGGWAELKGTDGGQPFDQKLRFADVWSKQNGAWKVVFTAVTKSEEP